jgi:hypothetical protein
MKTKLIMPTNLSHGKLSARKNQMNRQLIPASTRIYTSILIIVIIIFFASCDSAFDEGLNAESKMTLQMEKSNARSVPGTAQLLVAGLQGTGQRYRPGRVGRC